jgi:hypothetical protein
MTITNTSEKMLNQHCLNIVLCKMLKKKKKRLRHPRRWSVPKRQTATKSVIKNEKDN